jgi:twitching motility protein PilJ
MPRLVVAKQAARSINNESEPLLDRHDQARRSLRGQPDRARGRSVAAIAVRGAGPRLPRARRQGVPRRRPLRAQDSETRTSATRRHSALLNEMGNLADGDLTVQASVTEDVTGAIADSINFTIEELRTLVRGINSATDQVTKATQETQAISNRLYEASQRQNREIQQASASVLHDGAVDQRGRADAAQSAQGRAAQLAARKRAATRCRTRSRA